jgi:drug/metabolite transporter (DMT)-like permease
VTSASPAATGTVCVVASAVAFGAMAILARIAFASGVDTPTLLALRFAIAAIVMVVTSVARRVAFPSGSTLAVVVLLGAVGYGGQAFSFFTALTLAPAGVVALLLYLHPALVALLAALFLHERLTRVKLVALVLALAGTVLTIAPALASSNGIASDTGVVIGIAFAVAAAVFYSLYIVVGAWIGRRVAAFPVSTVVIASAAALFAVVSIVRGPQLPQTAAGWLAVLAIALLSTVAAVTLYFAGLQRIGPTRASTISTLEPLVTVTLAAIVLGERIATVQMAGGALILAAVVLLARARSA